MKYAILPVLFVCFLTGCAGTRQYLLDRHQDAMDVFTLTTGTGYGAKIKVGPLSTGLLRYNDFWGLRGGNVGGFDGDSWEKCYVVVRTDYFTPVQSILRDKDFFTRSIIHNTLEWYKGPPKKRRVYRTEMSGSRRSGGSLDLKGDLPTIPVPIRTVHFRGGGGGHGGGSGDLIGILAAPLVAAAAVAAAVVITVCFADVPIDELGRPCLRARTLEVEATVAAGPGIKAGFSPVEFLDFVLGFAKIDILKDDSASRRHALATVTR